MAEFRIAYPDLCNRVSAALIQTQVPQDIARQEAEIMAEADLLGVPSHGVRMLPPLLAALRDGRVNPRPNIRLQREFAAVSVMDGDNGPGRTISARAMADAVSRAKKFGIGACLAVRTTHWGRAHAYASRAAREGLVAICTTNAIPTMASWGTGQKVIGNNPIAFGIPRQEAEEPLVLDMAMSQAAVGKVNTWLREGREVPPGWGVDAEGKASTDAKAILGGAVLPFGGHKGAGLALVMELLTAALGGGAFGNEIRTGDPSGLDPDACKLFLALDPQAFCGLDTLTHRSEEYFAYLASVAQPAEAFIWPGKRGWAERDANLAQGVPLHADIIRQLADAGVLLNN